MYFDKEVILSKIRSDWSLRVQISYFSRLAFSTFWVGYELNTDLKKLQFVPFEANSESPEDK